MRCIDGENELILTCETQAEGVCILRCETRDPVVLLSLSVLSDAGIDAACTAAREAGQTAALSVLLAAAGPSKPRGRAKTFDL